MPTEMQRLEQKIADRLRMLEEWVFALQVPINGWRTKVGDTYLNGGIPEPDETWESITPGYVWMPDVEARWFAASAEVPSGWQGGPLIARLRFGGEAQVFVNEEVRGSVSRAFPPVPVRDEVILCEQARSGDCFELAVEATLRRCWSPVVVEPQTFELAELAVGDPEVQDLVYWLRVCLSAARALPDGGTERLRLVRLLDEVVVGVDMQRFPEREFKGSVQRASAELRDGLPDLARAGSLGDLTLAGVSHLDTAWLWTLSETKRKVGRTFSNALALMDRHPDFFFTQSQPQLYEYAKECFPQMYARIRERVAEGRWELIGGAWIENDYNMPGGEAIIRQLLYGKRFFQQEFGRDTNILWAPDTFGYTWALPQIMAHCGMEVFYTSKLSWSDTNEFPYGLFWWQGMDGTRVLAIQDNGAPPARLLPEELIAAWQRFPQRDRTGEFLHTFGYGDGGGGPTEEMIEHARRASGLVGVPRTRFGRVDECIARVKASMGSLPVWNDEIYFESHRGCQTSQARTKWGNRKMEFLLRDIEQLAALGGDSVGYPQDALQDMWERMLCHQFHDVLPGSSVRQVYVETEKDYQAMIARATDMRAKLLQSLAERVDTSGEGQAVVVHNTLSWERTDLVEVNIASAAESFNAISPEGKVGPCQILSRSDDGCTVLFLAEQVPAMGHAVYRVVPGTANAEPDCGATGSADSLENAELRLRFDESGRLASIFDKRSEREVLAPGTKGNAMQLFDDRPGSLDAWEIDPWFEDRMWEAKPPESVELVECGPLRAKLRHTRRSRGSAITQEICLYRHSRRVDFITEVDWHERHVLLKCAFPVDVLSPSATFEIQFGAIARPTHRSTSWDRAKFEVPAQRWADLSEDGYGVALLNDCKYGYDVKDNVLRLSLLRAPTDPDPEADQGRHRFTYALYPHIGSWQEAGVVRQGLELNAPLLAVAAPSSGGSLPPVGSALAVDRSDVVLDTLKKAEDGGDLILRLYEAHGGRGKVAVRVGIPVVEVSECNGMEVDIGPAEFRDGVIRFEIKPWQVRAFRLRRREA